MQNRHLQSSCRVVLNILPMLACFPSPVLNLVLSNPMTCSKDLARIRTGTWATQPVGTQLRIEPCNQLDLEPDDATN